MSTFESFESNILDLSYLTNAAQGDDEFILTMINSFLKNTPSYLEEINEHLQNRSYDSLSTIIHKYKGTVVIVGGTEIQDNIQMIEDLCRETSRQTQVIEEHSQKVISLSKQATEELTSFVQKNF
ncbi:MAG: Hpt domain-containing protein [Cytophagales bacterium]|nr:Hpt domain-containing protein [Cytophagales bacterium]